MAGKKRLDVLLTEQGLAESRQKAQAIIMAGQVFWEGRRMDKAGASVPEDAKLEVHGQTLRYVSRGGTEAGKGYGLLAHLAGGHHLCRYWSLHRWLYRLYAAKWSQ